MKRLRAFHGVAEQERLVGNIFEVSVSAELAPDRVEEATTSDDVAATVSYADMAEDVRAVMARPAQLLETVARRIADTVAARFAAVVAVTVKITKLTPPVTGPMAGASVTYSRTKE